MKYKDFLEYLENNLEGYQIFMRKAGLYQSSKSMKRDSKKRWSDEKMQKAAYDMWKASMEPLYNKLKGEVNSDFRESWISYVHKHEVLESVNEGIGELDFNSTE